MGPHPDPPSGQVATIINPWEDPILTHPAPAICWMTRGRYVATSADEKKTMENITYDWAVWCHGYSFSNYEKLNAKRGRMCIPSDQTHTMPSSPQPSVPSPY